MGYDIEQGKAARKQAVEATDFVTEHLMNAGWSNHPGLLHHIASGAVGSYLSTGMVVTKHLRGAEAELVKATHRAIAAAADEGLLPTILGGGVDPAGDDPWQDLDDRDAMGDRYDHDTRGQEGFDPHDQRGDEPPGVGVPVE